MKARKITALLLTIPMLMASFTACSEEKIKGKPSSNVNTSAGMFHPADRTSNYLNNIVNVCSWKGDYEYDPPIAGSELNVRCSIQKASEGNEPDLTMYIFKGNNAFAWDPDDVLASAEGTVEHGQFDIMRFTVDLPSDIDTDDYILVFVNGDGAVDSMFEQTIVASETETTRFAPVDKPVIYLYPEEETEAYVNVDLEGEFTCTYPAYGNNVGWHVIAHPDGMLTDIEGGRNYDYLYWEGMCDVPSGFETSICVRGEDTAEFLETYLEAAGLNYSEINDFITYWLPQMENNPYNLISFPTKEYELMAQLNVSPAPDTMIRVYMVFTPLESEITIPEEQQLQMPVTPERTGFTVVEWGGSQV